MNILFVNKAIKFSLVDLKDKPLSSENLIFFFYYEALESIDWHNLCVIVMILWKKLTKSSSYDRS